MQHRYFNYREDDKTFLLNQRLVGIIDAGRYRGFEYESSVGMSLTLGHSNSGIIQVGQDILPTAPMGLWITRQGTVIREDAAIVLPLDTNPTANPRIDLIIGSHNHVESVGGIVATYSVVKGTPSATPVAPALPNANRDVILARVLVPAGATSIAAANVTPEPTPTYAQDPQIAFLNKTQYFKNAHATKSMAKDVGFGQFDLANDAIVLGKAGAVGLVNIPANPDADFFVVFGDVLSTPLPTTYIEVKTLSFASARTFFGAVPPKTNRVTLFFTYPVKFGGAGATNVITPDGNVIYIDAYTPVSFYQPYGNVLLADGVSPSNDYWILENGGEVVKDGINKVRGLISHSIEISNPTAGFALPRSTTQPRNVIKIGANNVVSYNDISYSEIRYIQSKNYYNDGSVTDSGTEITILPADADVFGAKAVIRFTGAVFGAPPAPAGYKPILIPDGHILQIDSGTATFVETENYWVLKSFTGHSDSLLVNLTNVASTVTTNAFIERVQRRSYLSGIIVKPSGAGAINAGTPTIIASTPSVFDIYNRAIYTTVRLSTTVHAVGGGYYISCTLTGAGDNDLVLNPSVTLNNSTTYTIYLSSISF